MTDIVKLRALALADDVESYLEALDTCGIADTGQLQSSLDALRVAESAAAGHKEAQ